MFRFETKLQDKVLENKPREDPVAHSHWNKVPTVSVDGLGVAGYFIHFIKLTSESHRVVVNSRKVVFAEFNGETVYVLQTFIKQIKR